jgi:dUTPase
MAADDHAARHHQIQCLAFLAFVEDDFIGQVAALVHQAVDDFQFERRQRREQGRFFQAQQTRRHLGRFEETENQGNSRAGRCA